MTTMYVPQTTVETMARITAGVDPWITDRDFLEDWTFLPESRPELMARKPGFVGEEQHRWAGLLAASIEALCARDGLVAPALSVPSTGQPCPSGSWSSSRISAARSTSPPTSGPNSTRSGALAIPSSPMCSRVRASGSCRRVGCPGQRRGGVMDREHAGRFAALPRPGPPRPDPAPRCNLLPRSCHVCDVTNPHVGHALDCAHASRLIDAFLLDELDPADAARLAAHVKGCAACTTEIGSSTLVLALLGSLPVPRPTADLDERTLLAALDDRARRHAHRSWLSELRTQVLRGAMRTTGTLIVTILSVALLGGALVLAASEFVQKLPVFTGQGATIWPVATPTPMVPVAQTAEPTFATPRPSPVISATPVPVITPAPTDSAAPTMSPEPSPAPPVEPSPSATAEPTPTPTPSPSPTDKGRRPTPPPPTADPTPSP